MKKLGIVKGIINYIFAMVFAIIFGLFLDANVGWFILLILILAPVLSVFLAWLSAGMLQFACQVEDALLSKGDICQVQVMVQNRFFLPSPPITVDFTDEAGVRSKTPNLLLSVFSKGVQNVEVTFQAKICGRCEIGIASVRVMDYLGLFSFPVRKLDYTTLKGKVSVIPDITEISARDDNLLKIVQSSHHMDDGEDTMESSTYAFGGFPGYDNRDYVPGDPLKRINWKQSAKRNKLLVRLDDEMAARSVNVVLDSMFLKQKVDIRGVSQMLQYSGLTEKEIVPKMAEDAIEGALGITRTLIRMGYTVNFYVNTGNAFEKHEILDEIDLESIRLLLADYSFSEEDIQRVPVGENGLQEKASVYVTPNRYEQVYALLDVHGGSNSTTIYAVLEEARKQNNEESSLFLMQTNKLPEQKKESFKEKAVNFLVGVAVPYLLGLMLSIAMFSIFDIPFWSVWTLLEAGVCAGIVLLCHYVNRHRIIGGMIVTLLVLGLLSTAARLAFGDGLLNYMHWFMSGGESVVTTTDYLLSILLIFTCFYAMSTYYFVKILYRTSFLLLISLIPFVSYVKIMLDIQMWQVAIVTVLNMAAFMIYYRGQKDVDRKRVGIFSEILSVGTYVVIFVLMGLAVPEADTKYYYMFENAFLGGNVSEAVPEEYSEMSEYSGNADGFNELNDRKLYVITGVEQNKEFYLDRQAFDLYDFKYDRWYGLDAYDEPSIPLSKWYERMQDNSLALLLEAMQVAESYSPGMFEEYGITVLPTSVTADEKLLMIETTNFASAGFVTPAKALTVNSANVEMQIEPWVTQHGIFLSMSGPLDVDLNYSVKYYDEEKLQSQVIACGMANMDMQTSIQMLGKMQKIFDENGLEEYYYVAMRFKLDTQNAMAYMTDCAENTAQIPDRVVELAKEITKDCTYDWEKAAALQNYFRENDFVYDLEYDAPDDSVEYFLFKGKTGTCSDFASAYVLMARAVGLTVRYMEGFVPDMEYNGDYVVRTNNGHAYPQVFIPNIGYMTVEATLPASYGYTGGYGGGAGYFLTVIVRLVVILAAVSALILTILFVYLIATPFVRELYFNRKINKANPSQTAVLLYKRLSQKVTKNMLHRAYTMTPYEYAECFEQKFHYDISSLIYMVEKTAYAVEALKETDKKLAIDVYEGAREAVKKWKKAPK